VNERSEYQGDQRRRGERGDIESADSLHLHMIIPCEREVLRERTESGSRFGEDGIDFEG
jgi:hypothetical protein